MRKLCIVLGIISSVLALVLSVLPLSNLAYFPAIAALVFGFIAFYMSNKNNQSKKTIQLVFLLTTIAFSISIYKSIFNTVEVGNTEELEQREIKSEEKAIEELEELDLDIDDLDIDEKELDIDTEDLNLDDLEIE
ncbi:FUSC family protein [Xanthomarina sp. F2636L]|uniref:FUSC family protein n=1 Tax=Xanthomarina sp. F2636L TaxID=2996018 RepID=UPI00225E3F20|nr:FUSC family protein [Xanthomarina sp. F2636L]MCX7551867.1 FUSC family protein [Xanthomarina sp. F2636L]